MTTQKTYINVIVPLKFDEDLCYFTFSRVTVGERVKVAVAGREYVGVVSGTEVEPRTSPSKIKEIAGVEESLGRISENEIALWRRIAEYYMCSVGEVYKAAYPSGLVGEEKKSRIDKEKPEDEPVRGNIELSAAQEVAFEKIKKAFSQGKTALLEGVTGSGKTEIYISLALKAIRNCKNILYLVPEIAMSRQLEERLRSVFGSLLLISHSEETMHRRRNVVETIRSGKQYIALGTRSAIFLPHRDLGLIIVDEEHESSYKQDSPAPRYNARDAALMLGALCGCNTILGSATPSLESLYNCNIGRFIHIKLDERYHNAQDSEVVIIDTNAERRKRGMVGTFSRKLIGHINTALEAGEQVMILRTRRSYSPVVQCIECGAIPKCPRCNVSLSYHKDREILQCHYCGYSVKMQACPECGGTLQGLGSGTQKIEEEAAALFPNARIARLDSDTGKSEENRIIREFSKGQTDILVGTQIIAKGFDFENLTLVAALQADTLLGMQDFRADEKAVQILEQLRGRCGRRARKGIFVIQTNQPEHPAYRQEEGYSARLLAERREFGYPPYTRSINVVIKDKNEARVDKIAGILARTLQNLADTKNGMTVSHPWMPTVNRIADENIRIIRINLGRDKSLGENKSAIASRIDAFESLEHYRDHIYLDVDPI